MEFIQNKQLIGHIAPDKDSMRHSEGDFIKLKDGRIMFAYSRFGAKSFNDHSCSDIVAVMYDPVKEILDSTTVILKKATDMSASNLMSVTLLRMQNDDIGMFYIKKIPGLKSQIILSRSSDEARSFYIDILCCPIDFEGYHVLNNNRVMRLSNGRLIMPLSLHRAGIVNDKEVFDGRGTVFFYYSDDDGYTWQKSNSILNLPSHNTKTGLQEPGVIELPNGSLYAYFRTDQMVQYESYSFDNGNHWALPQPSKFSSPDSPMKIAKNPYSDKYYAIWNPIPSYNGRLRTKIVWGRTPLVISYSDNGTDFSEPEILEDDPDRGFCYPAIFFIDEKTMLLAYCSGGELEKSCLCRTTITKVTVQQ